MGIGNWSTHAVNGAIYPLSYDLLNDLEPVALLPSSPQVIVANDRVPADNLAQLVSWAKSNKANVATAGVGSASDASGLFFQKRTGAEITFVSYRSGGQALKILVAGHVELMFDQVSNALPQIRAGAIKAYAVTAKSRIASAPDIPTVDEAGLPGFYISVWYGLWVPKQTPSDVISKLNAAVVATLQGCEPPKALRGLWTRGAEAGANFARSPSRLAKSRDRQVVADTQVRQRENPTEKCRGKG